MRQIGREPGDCTIDRVARLCVTVRLNAGDPHACCGAGWWWQVGRERGYRRHGASLSRQFAALGSAEVWSVCNAPPPSAGWQPGFGPACQADPADCAEFKIFPAQPPGTLVPASTMLYLSLASGYDF